MGFAWVILDATAGEDIEWKIEGHSGEPSSSHFENQG